jgi:hypothetical protein
VNPIDSRAGQLIQLNRSELFISEFEPRAKINLSEWLVAAERERWISREAKMGYWVNTTYVNHGDVQSLANALEVLWVPPAGTDLFLQGINCSSVVISN